MLYGGDQLSPVIPSSSTAHICEQIETNSKQTSECVWLHVWGNEWMNLSQPSSFNQDPTRPTRSMPSAICGFSLWEGGVKQRGGVVSLPEAFVSFYKGNKENLHLDLWFSNHTNRHHLISLHKGESCWDKITKHQTRSWANVRFLSSRLWHP